MHKQFGPRAEWIRTFQTATVPFFAVTLAEHADSHAVDKRVPWIVFRQGKIHVGDFVVQSPEFRGDSVAWCQTSQLGFTSGHLYYGRGGAELQGFVSLGRSQDTAEIMQVVATALPFGQFSTTITEPGGEPVAGPPIRLGYQRERGMAAEPAVLVNEEDVSGHFALSLEGDEPALSIHLEDASKWGDLQGHVQLRFRVAAGAEVEFSGTIKRIGADDKVRTLSLRGELAPGEAALAEPQAVPLVYTDTDLPSFEAALQAEDPLTDEELRTVYAILAKVPDDRDLGQQTFTYMQQNMKWAMSQDAQADEIQSRRKWLEMYYNTSEPFVPGEARKASIRQHLGWYNNTMAVALLAQGVASMPPKPDLLPRPISSPFKRAIDKYVQDCLAQSEEFRDESEAVWCDMYIEQSAGLKKIAAEDQLTRAAAKAGQAAPRTWASRVREYFTTPEQLLLITTGLYTEARLRPGEEPASKPKSQEDLEARIQELTNGRERLQARLQEFKNAKAGADDLNDLEEAVQAKSELIDLYKDQKDAISQTRYKATATIKNVSSLLKALDPSAELARGYADQAGGAVLAATAAHTDSNAIPDYGDVLEGQMEKFLGDLAGGRLKIFDEKMDAQLAAQTRELMAHERLDTKSLASKMTRVLTNARGANFMEKADRAASTFAGEHPALTNVFRMAMIAAYAYTVVRMFQLIGKDPGHVSTLDQGAFYFTATMLAVETIRSFLPNAKAFFETSKAFFSKIMAHKAEAEALKEIAKEAPGKLAQWFGSFRTWSGNLINHIGAGLARLGSGIARLATSIAETTAVKWLIGVVRSTFTAITGMVGNALSTFGSAVGRMATDFAHWFKGTFPRFCAFAGKALAVLAKGLVIAASVWSTISEGIACKDLWKSDRQLGAKIMTTVAFIAFAVSGVASIFGMFSTAFIWSGIGVAVGLVAFGLTVLVQLIWKEDSPLQKLVDKVLMPFIRDVADVAVKAKEAAEKEHRGSIIQSYVNGVGVMGVVAAAPAT